MASVFSLRLLGEYDALTAIESRSQGSVSMQTGGYHTGKMHHKGLSNDDYEALIQDVHALAQVCRGQAAPFSWQVTIHNNQEQTLWMNLPLDERQAELIARITALAQPIRSR